MSDLNDLRKRINELDEKLVQLLNERAGIVLDIGKVKEAADASTYVPSREKEVCEHIDAMNHGPLPDKAFHAIYREIMSASLALERGVQIAYLGPMATFTHQAARSRFGAGVTYVAAETITDVFTCVEKQKAEFGVVPIENSTEGAVTHTLDKFSETPLKICAEIYLSISQNLMAKEPKDQIKRIYSYSPVFGQCRRWLHENMPGVELLPISSTAKAAEKASQEFGSAAIASPLAAELYDLHVLNEDIQDMSGNTTRFLVIGKDYGPRTGNDKTSILFAVKHKVGALYDAISSFRKYELNMMKIESRPSRTKAWEYHFFVDLEGHVDDEGVEQALEDLSEHCTFMTVLGAYPKVAEVVT